MPVGADYCFSEQCAHANLAAIAEHTSGVRELCQPMRSHLAQAGLSGLLEATPCPILALHELQDKDTDDDAQRIFKEDARNRLGLSFVSTEETL